MYKTKLNRINNLIERVKNDINLPIISDFLEWFFEKLDIHFNKNISNLKLNKGDIVFVKLGKNIGSELNKTRPCLVYSNKLSNFGNTVIIVPLKSYKGKININFNIFIKSSENTSLNKDSIVDISSIRQISKKRIFKRIGKLDKKYLNEIDSKIIKIFSIKKDMF
ncbi:MAG: type II toxin-antitoxin system PemK/MazF family toxin [Candidatus Gracilibacteria bacterium]|nr:type II toxin-antitoxin system PemK/MazF family toxin [Candidatus Gracilibacteria bacterium]